MGVRDGVSLLCLPFLWQQYMMSNNVSIRVSWPLMSREQILLIFWVSTKWHTYLLISKLKVNFVQLNRYETAPYFFLLNQNLTRNCLLISVNYPVFTSMM
jgi:hypothetical protein